MEGQFIGATTILFHIHIQSTSHRMGSHLGMEGIWHLVSSGGTSDHERQVNLMQSTFGVHLLLF